MWHFRNKFKQHWKKFKSKEMDFNDLLDKFLLPKEESQKFVIRRIHYSENFLSLIHSQKIWCILTDTPILRTDRNNSAETHRWSYILFTKPCISLDIQISIAVKSVVRQGWNFRKVLPQIKIFIKLFYYYLDF